MCQLTAVRFVGGGHLVVMYHKHCWEIPLSSCLLPFLAYEAVLLYNLFHFVLIMKDDGA